MLSLFHLAGKRMPTRLFCSARTAFNVVQIADHELHHFLIYFQQVFSGSENVFRMEINVVANVLCYVKSML